MKNIYVTYDEHGGISSLTDDNFVFEQENVVVINPAFPDSLTGDIRVYLRAQNGSGAFYEMEGETFTIPDELMIEGVLRVGFEIKNGGNYIRFEPFKIEIRDFVRLSDDAGRFDYTVTVEVDSVEQLDFSEVPTVENVGTNKDVRLKFGIPKGSLTDEALLLKQQMDELTYEAEGYKNTAQEQAEIAATQAGLAETAKNNAISALSGLQTQVNNMADGSPKGVYATVAALETALPTGDTGIYVVTADGHWYYWNDTAWTDGGTYQATLLEDGSITDGMLANAKASYNPDTGEMKGAYTPFVTYQHPRGDTEMIGDSYYQYLYQKVILGFFERMPVDTVFNRFAGQIYVRENSMGGLEYKIFIRDTSDVFNPSEETPVAEGTLTANQVSHSLETLTDFQLDMPISVAKNKYLFVLFRATAGGTVIGRWTTASSNPSRKRILYTITETWDDTLNLAGGTDYRLPSFKLWYESFEYRHFTDEFANYNPVEHIGAGEITDSMLANAKATIDPNTGKLTGYIPYVQYQHSRGDEEMLGNSTYSYKTGNVVGFRERMATDIVFNKFEGYVFAPDSNAAMEWKIYVRSSSTPFNPQSTSSVASGTLTADKVSHSTSVPTVIELDTPILVKKDQYVFVLFRAIQGATTINRWTTSASDPARHGFMYTTSGWNQTFSVGSTGYYQTAIKLYLASEEIKGFEIPDDYLAPVYDRIDDRTKPRIILPDEVVAVVGDKLQLFVRAMIEAQNPYNMPYEMVCSVGNAYPRYFEYTAAAGDVGTKTLTVRVRNNKGSSVVSDTVNIIVKNPTGQPSSETKVLCVGDSLMSGFTWAQEFYRRLTQSGGSPAGKGYGNISFIGNAPLPDYPTQYAVGYSGWRWDTYMGVTGSGAGWVNSNPDGKDITDQKAIYVDINNKQWWLETIESDRIKVFPYGGASQTLPETGTLTWQSGGTHHGTITYTTVTPEAATPFWDSTANEFSFSGFCDTYGFDGIDIMYVLLGWNGLAKPNKYLASDHTENIAKAKAFVDQLHSDYPDAEVRLMGLQVPSVNGGLGANYGATVNDSYYNLLRSVNGWNMALQDMVNEEEYSGFCKYISIAHQFDSEYNMPQSTAAVNSRNSTTEIRGTNGIHPATEGYYQIADAAYRDFIRTYCS